MDLITETHEDEHINHINQNQNDVKPVPAVSSEQTTSVLGKACLICRRRKIKCDKTKPVCMKCIKHNSTMDCMYEEEPKETKKKKKAVVKKSVVKKPKNNISTLSQPHSTEMNSSIHTFVNYSDAFSGGDIVFSDSVENQHDISNKKIEGNKQIKSNSFESDIEKTPLISIPGSNNEMKTIYLTDVDNLANKQKVTNLGLNYISPIMKNTQKKIYKRRYSKILLEEEREELLKQTKAFDNIILKQDDSKHTQDTMEMISTMQRDKPGKISGKFADLSIVLQKKMKRERLLKELSTLKKQLGSMESLIDGSIHEEEMELEELEMKFDRFNPREYDASNPNTPLVSRNDPNYYIYSNISKMSFYDGFEQVTVFNARLNFNAPLSAQVVLKKDPFGKVINIMVEKTLHEYARTLEVKKSSEKYDALRVTDSNSLPTLITTANNSARLKKKTADGASASSKRNDKNSPLKNILDIDKLNEQAGNADHNNQVKSAVSHDLGVPTEEDVDEEEDEEYSDNDSHEEATNEIFNKQFLENEGIDEMKAIIKEGKIAYTKPIASNNNIERLKIKNAGFDIGSGKFSTSNIREDIKPVAKQNNEIQTENSINSKSGESKSNVNPENDPAFWSNLNKVLNNIDSKETLASSYNSLARVPEGLFGSESSLEHELVLQIQDILPPGKLINIHCKNFFKSPIHGLYPIINEDWWMDTMHRLLGFSESQLNSDQPPKVNIARRFDIAKLATLLVMMRLSFFTYPDNIDDCTTEEEKLVLKHPIGKEFISLAQRSLNIFKMLRKGILPVLHCALLLRVYRKYAPEEGDIVDGSDSETFTGFLVKISTSIGLNTDVARSSWVKDQKMYVDQWRKCWYCVYFFDFMEVCNMGNTTSIDIDSFDTKLPDFKLDPLTATYPSFVIDSHLEDIVVSNYQKNFETSLIARELLSCITNKRVKFSVPNLQMLLNNLDGSISKNFGKSLKELIDLEVVNLADSVFKLNSFIWFIELKALQFYCYIHIFIHIDEQINSNQEIILSQDQLQEKIELFHFYLKKIIEIYVEIEPVLILGYDSSKIDIIFGKGSRFIVIQACENLIIRFIPGLHVIASRFLHFKFNYLNVSPVAGNNVSKITEDIIKILMDKLSHSGGICRLLSKKYFQMWRISQSNQFIFYLLNKPADNNLLKKDSKINNLHREDWQYHNGNTFEDFYPFRNIPMYNLLTAYQLSHFQEVFSTLNNVKWNIFANYYTESELKQGIHYRDKQYETAFQKFLKKNGNSNRRGRKEPKAKKTVIAKTNNSPTASQCSQTTMDSSRMETEPLDDMSQNRPLFTRSRTSTSNDNSIDSSAYQQNNIMIDEIDKYWYENYLSDNYDMLQTNQQTNHYQSLDDLFDGTSQENNFVNNEISATDMLKHQVIERLANLVPEATEKKPQQKPVDSKKSNDEFTTALQSFLFNSGNAYYSDEINF